MTAKSLATGIGAVVLVVAVVSGYRWWASDERAIRNQMDTIADALSATPDEGDLGSVTRLARLRNVLAPDIRVSSAPRSIDDSPPPQETVGRDTVLALASRWAPRGRSVTVEFVDVEVTVEGDRAQVYCTVTVTSRDASGQPTIDAREVTAGFAKTDGEWLVASAWPNETLTR